MKLKSRIAALAAISLGVAGLAASASAEPAPPTQQDVRHADFVSALSDTRSAGHVDFLKEGLHVYTDDATSNAKAAEYFPMSGALPTSASQEWFGTSPEPGKQIVFDADGTTGNGNDYNVLVGEPVYGNVWWLSNGSSADAKAADPSGDNNGGNGSDYFGTLAQWKEAMPNAHVLAGGFSLGSGVKGDGVLRSQTYGDQKYVFTDEDAVVTPPVQTPTNVAGSSTFKKGTRSVSVTVKADALGANQTEKNQLVWKIRVDGFTALTDNQHANSSDTFAQKFKRHTGTHEILVYKNGSKVRSLHVSTR